MNGINDVLDELESRTSVERRDGEPLGAYLDRLDDELDIEDADRERLEELAQKQMFAPEPTLSDEERRDLDAICSRLNSSSHSNLEADVTVAESSVTRESISNGGAQANTDVVENAATRSDSTPSGPQSASKGGIPASGDRSSNPVSAIVAAFYSSSPSHGLGPQENSYGFLSRPDLRFVIPLLLAGIYVFFYELGGYPLSTWDEGFYGNLARHMVQDGYWVVPHMYYAIGLNEVGFEPWLRLPPLGIWIQAISMLVFGVNEFAVRFQSALASVLTVLVVYAIGRTVTTRRGGFFSGLVYLTTPYVYSGFNAGRDGGLDALLVLFGTLFVYTTLLAVKRQNPSWLYFTGLFGGLAVLTKGFGAGVFLIVVLPLVFVRQAVFKTRELVYATGITAVLTLPWPVYMYSLYGDRFVRIFVERYVLDRAAGEAFGANTNTILPFMDFPYFQELLFNPSLLHPWVFVFLFGVFAFGYRVTVVGTDWEFGTPFLIWWAFAVLGLFVFIGNKRWYIMPMYVPVAALVGTEIEAALDGSESAVSAITLGVFGVFVISPEYSLALDGGVNQRALIFVFGVVLLVWFGPIRDAVREALPETVQTKSFSIAPILVAILLVGALIGTPPTGGSEPQKALAEELTRQTDASTPVFIQSEMPVAYHSFSFYAQRPLGSGNVSKFQESGMRYGIFRQDSLSQLRSDYRILMNTSTGGTRVSLVEVERR